MAWNAFRFCSGLRVLGYVMILLVAALIGVTYYALVITTYGPHLFKGGSDFFGALVVIVLFHALLIMLIWCYSMVVFTDPGSVPLNWRPMTDEDDVEAQPLPNTSGFQPTENSKSCEEMLGSTFCRKCQNHKPPRCHHCRVCQRCIMKMDHHCVWVVNCVGAHNYKFFLLFLVYTFLATTMAVLALLPYFIDFFKDVQKHDGSPSALATTFLAFILNVAFSLSLLGFLIMHSSLLLSNTTTIEVYEKKKSEKWKYDMGRKENFEQVFGKKKGYWLIPLYSEGDKTSLPVLHGFDYPIRSDLES